MKIYHYDSSTGAFAGASEADPNPREPDSYLIPAFATEIAPPVTSNEQYACWKGVEWVIYDNPKLEVNETLTPPEITWEKIRHQRNYLLSQTDWIFAPDVNLANKEAWLTYRQALRDIPQMYQDPTTIIWPAHP